MPDAQLISEMALLVVTTHPDAEIFLIGNDRQLVARAVGDLQSEQPKGLYRIKVTRASAAVERLLDLDADMDLHIEVPGLDTTVPFRRTLSADALQQIKQLASQATSGQSPSPNLLLIGRTPVDAPPADGKPAAAVPAPLSSVRLVSWASGGGAPSKMSATEARIIGNEVWAIAGQALEAGTYLLEINDGRRITQQAVPVSPRWQTRVFVRRQTPPAVLRSEASTSSDLIDVAIHMTRPGTPIALEPTYESSEIARLALAMGSLIVVSPKILNVFINEKFADPMAGLAAAHLMFDALEASASKNSSIAPDVSTLQSMAGIVITNLTNLLRMPEGGSSDLVALKLRAKLPLSDEEKAITEPPAYARSWKALLDASTGATPQINIAADLFARCAANFTSGAYLAWTPTSVANFLEQFAAGNRNSLQWIAGAKAAEPPAANAPPHHAADRSQVRIKVRDHIATALGADKSQLGPETDLTKHLQLGERDLHALAGQINRTGWMKSLSSRLDPGDIKGVTTIGGLTNVILNKAARQTSAGTVATPMQAPPVQRPEDPAATLTTILADEKSRFRLADQIGIPRSVLDALAKPSAALPQPGSLPPAVPGERADDIVVGTAALQARPAAALAISPRAFDMIVALEVTSRQVYDERYHRPVWPSEASGIIIGIGYDLARVSKEQLRLDWQGSLAEETIAALEPAAGASAQAAKQLAPALAASVDIPWDKALAVHGGKVIPRWIGIVDRALANCRIVPPDCLGALLSLTYDQGDGYAQPGDPFREMRAIRDHMAALRFSAVAGEIRAMNRLWPDNPGLTERREREAKLFEDGLAGLSAR